MIRKSVWKFPFIKNYNRTSTYIDDGRNITITSKLIGRKVLMYRGNRWNKMKVEHKFVNHKMGEFFVTKILGGRVAYRKKIKERKKKSKMSKKHKK